MPDGSRPTHTDFDHAPFVLFWETTRACDLACLHCRACAIAARDPRELTAREGERLLEEAHAMGVPLVVLTGGDPAKRPDLARLVRHGTDLGLRIALTPSATPLVTTELLTSLHRAGLARLAVSLDGTTAAVHDAFRGVPGSFERTLAILEGARALGLTTQVNTSLSLANVDQLEDLARMLESLDIELFSVFLVVPTGRAKDLAGFTPDAVEDVLERLARISEQASFDVKTTAAPHYRRVLLQRKARGRIVGLAGDGIGRVAAGINDGRGIAFVSHHGDVYPSGFLPVACGNVRVEGLAKSYRESFLMRQLRDPDALGGKCGDCEFRRICGGSRARAYAVHGDPSAEDPLCAYMPGARSRRTGGAS